jgi:hypothetical protein
MGMPSIVERPEASKAKRMIHIPLYFASVVPKQRRARSAFLAELAWVLFDFYRCLILH